MKALERLESFKPRGEGAFLAYLRRILLNALRDELRRPMPDRESVTDEIPAPLPSLVEAAIGRQVVERYEEAPGRPRRAAARGGHPARRVRLQP
jgi:RNA polymerase sigma-70 factor (ECF subfamily)